jgi:sugar O-acyltransferase (sialic acid O-acetyltransferase NeuD family)
VALALYFPAARQRLFSYYGAAVVELRSAEAYLSARAHVGPGCIIQRGVTVMPRARIGACCKLNLHSTVHHDARIGDFSTLAPGCRILGSVVVGERVYVGAGAVIRQRCRIGAGSVIGAGAVVVSDVSPEAVVVGVPAKRRLK